ncbi:MAG: hypothetical protein ABI851_03785 [Saprospiraceae bacterium]
MRAVSLILILLCFQKTISSQIGYELNLSSHNLYQKQSNRNPNPVDIQSYGLQLGGQYWFRLKNYRVEFIPGIHLGTEFSQKKNYSSYKITDVHLLTSIPLLIYPLNFKEDCNCPTFKKSGKKFEKGFHLIVQPGLSFNRRNINHDSVTLVKNNMTPILGLGAGMDIGINRLMTITPFILYSIYFNDCLLKTEKEIIEIQHHSINVGVRIRLYKNTLHY